MAYHLYGYGYTGARACERAYMPARMRVRMRVHVRLRAYAMLYLHVDMIAV